MLELYRFDTVYIADLDAIMGQAPQASLIAQLHQQFPQLRWMVDAGFRQAQAILNYPCPIQAVIGSESIQQIAQWQALQQALADDLVLSLDYRAGQFLGCAALWQQDELWPSTLIAMSLSHVGSGAGPDWQWLEQGMQKKPSAKWIAAGGIRNQQDWHKLKSMGVHAGLMASALHQIDCQITKDG